MPQDQVPANNTLQILPNGIIEIKQTGFQTADSIAMYQGKVDDMTAEMHKEGKKVLILVDVSEVTGQEPEVLKLAQERMKGDYDALAVFGTSAPVKMIVNWLLHATGSDERVKSFGNRDEAVKWLLSH